MLNSLEVYRDAGRKAGNARRHHDEGLAGEMNRWLWRAVALEATVEDKNQARQAYDEGYRDGRGVMPDPWAGLR